MKKKLLAVVTALTVMAMGTVTAFAASPTVGTTEAPVATQNLQQSQLQLLQQSTQQQQRYLMDLQ